MHQIFIISDGTGRTAKQALNAALTQYENTEVKINIRRNIRSKSQIMNIILEAKKNNGLIIHTLVSKNLRDIILDQGRFYNIETIDLMGPLLGQLSQYFANLPSEKPGIFHEINKSYFQRIEAVEFSLRHDDGQKPDELSMAEIIILGVSRTFKTPISIYLAFRGWLVANIPIILDIDLPEIIAELPPDRIFGLTTMSKKLSDLRKVRDKHLGGATGDYASLKHVQHELNYARGLYDKHPGWTIIDVTNKPIEEISNEILDHLKNHPTIRK